MRYIDHYKGIRKQERTTPIEFFAQLHSRFAFTMDGAASAENALLPRFSSLREHLSWEGERVFINPPWSEIQPFLELAPLAEFACFLIPARVNARWFHRALYLGATPEYFAGRLKFDGLASNSPIDCLLLKFGSEFLLAGQETHPSGPTASATSIL